VGAGRPDPLLAEGVALAERARPAELRLPVEGSDLGWVMRPRGSDVEVVLGREDLEARLARWEQLRGSAAVELGAGAQVDLRFADQAVLRKDARLGGAERKAAAARGGAPPSARGRPEVARPSTGRSGGSPRRRSRRASKGG
jgi:hypothetical protein